MSVKHFEAVVKRRTNVGQALDDMETIITGVTYQVLAVGTDTAETLYSDKGITSKTNPVTTTVFAVDDQIDFYCDPTDATYDKYVDLIVVDTVGGFTAFVDNFSPNQRVIVIDECPNVRHHGCIWFTASNNVATDTGVDFVPHTAIYDVVAHIVTIDDTETLNIGTADTAAGFRSGINANTAGYVADTAVPTNGTNADYYPATTYGTLLATALTGADTAVTTIGGIRMKPHFVKTAGTDDDLYYTGSAGTDTMAGYIHYWFERLR